MTEEKKDVIEIKKESLNQFFTIVGASFIGCFLAILLAGQLLKPKAPCFCPHRIMTPPPYAMVMDNPHHKKFHKQGYMKQNYGHRVKPDGQHFKNPQVVSQDSKKLEQK